jgi:hypothetical protein
LQALKDLADAGLGEASVLANLHHRRIVPLMERRLRIFEMDDTTDPVALAQSRLLLNLLPQENAATRARRTINLKAARHGDDDLWSFVMLPPRPAGEWNLCLLSHHLLAACQRGLTFRSFPAAGDPQLLSRTHGRDSPCLQNNYNAQSTPEVTVRTTLCYNDHDIPTICTRGIVNLAKILMGVREYKCVCK